MNQPEFRVVPTSLQDRKITDERSKSLSVASQREMESWSIKGGVEFSESSYESAVRASEDKTLPPESVGPVPWGGG